MPTTSGVRRRARRFCSSALKGASRTRWRDYRTVWVLLVPEKASQGVEKSFRSNRKSHRGLRSFSSKRARGGKPRQPEDRQPVSEPKDRAISRALREIDFWSDRLSSWVTEPLRKKYLGRGTGQVGWTVRAGLPLPGPHLRIEGSALFLRTDLSATTGLSFDDRSYRYFRTRFERLHARACRCAAARVDFPSSWGHYLEKNFGYVVSRSKRAREVLSAVQGDILERVRRLPQRVLVVGRHKKTWRKPPSLARRNLKASPCLTCGSTRWFSHTPECVFGARRGRRGGV
jgi:hypothetical protein